MCVRFLEAFFQRSHIVRLLLLGIVLLGIPVTSNAHDSNLAAMQIRKLEHQVWVYEVMTPLYSLDQSMRSFNADRAEQVAAIEVGSIEYKQEIVAHIKQGFNIQVSGFDTDGNAVTSRELSLGQGRISLGDHLSTLIFEIKGMPERVDELSFYLNNMSNNPKQTNLLRLIEGDRQTRYSLHSENNFSGVDRGFFRDHSL